MQNVSTKRRDKINSDEEERFRLGYELKTGVRFEEHQGRLLARAAGVEVQGLALARLTYGHATTIWRINLGWRRRKDRAQQGFVLDVERGYWARNEAVAGDEADPMSQRTARVIPYVEDRRNCLLIEPAMLLDEGEMASLQAALKSAIQIEFQLEDNELAAEPLPHRDDRRVILLYESAEGGAGVLHRLLGDPDALARVARQALDVCHYDAATGEVRRRAEHAREDCEAACYDCLMSYGNQGDHGILDRASIQPLLLQLAAATVVPVHLPASAPPRDFSATAPSSDVERDWLRYLERRGHGPPTGAGVAVEACGATPDFLYEHEGCKAAIYVDGPPGESQRSSRDAAMAECLEDRGYTVLRFASPDGWDALLDAYAYIFGPPTPRPAAQAPRPSFHAQQPAGGSEAAGLDLDLFDPRWHPLVRALAERPGVSVDAGGDVQHNGRVAGSYLAEVSANGRTVHLVHGDSADAARVRMVLQEKGHDVIVVRSHDVNEAVAAVMAALDGKS